MRLDIIQRYIISLQHTHMHTGEISHFSPEIDRQTLNQSNRGDFHLASDDKRHVSPPNRNKGDGDIVATETRNETLQGLHRA